MGMTPIAGKENEMTERETREGPCQACEDAAKLCESLVRGSHWTDGLEVGATASATLIRSSCRHSTAPSPPGATPRTDAVVVVCDGAPGWRHMVDADFARQLERDLASTSARLEKSEKALSWSIHETSLADKRAERAEVDAVKLRGQLAVLLDREKERK